MEDHCQQTSQLTIARRFPTATCPEKKDARIVLEPKDTGSSGLVEVAPLGVLMQFVKANHFYCPCEMAIFLGLNEKLPEAFSEVASGSKTIHPKINPW